MPEDALYDEVLIVDMKIQFAIKAKTNEEVIAWLYQQIDEDYFNFLKSTKPVLPIHENMSVRRVNLLKREKFVNPEVTGT